MFSFADYTSGDEEGFKSWGAWIGRPDLDDHSTWFWRVLLLGLLVAELSRMRNPIKNMDHWGHFGGYLSGICGAEALLWQARRNERRAKSNLELPLVPASLQTTSTA